MQQSVIDFEHARQERDAGMQRSVQKAERIDDEWPEVAYSFLTRYARTHEFFQGWEVTRDAKAMGYGAPTDDRAWGAIYRRALQDGVMVVHGVGRNPNRHASICPRYQSLVYVGGAA